MLADSPQSVRLTSTVRGSAWALGARRLASRLARSDLLQTLAAPHGVERYLELLTPGLSIAELRGAASTVQADQEIR
jgi:hypothetical protein